MLVYVIVLIMHNRLFPLHAYGGFTQITVETTLVCAADYKMIQILLRSLLLNESLVTAVDCFSSATSVSSDTQVARDEWCK